MRKPFEGVFGNTAELRMLEFLLPLEGIEFNITELAEEVGISRPTAQKIVKKFLEYGILKISREQGGIKYYELNPESPFVVLVNEINNVLIAKMVGPEVMREVEQYWSKRIVEELRRMVENVSQNLKAMLSSELESLPISRESIGEESIISTPRQPEGVYVSIKNADTADNITTLGGEINAA